MPYERLKDLRLPLGWAEINSQTLLTKPGNAGTSSLGTQVTLQKDDSSWGGRRSLTY